MTFYTLYMFVDSLCTVELPFGVVIANKRKEKKMKHKQKTCSERVESHLESRAKDFTRFMNGQEKYEGEFSEYGLSFDYVEPYTFNDQPTGYYRYQLSWGGPSDEIRFFENGTIYYVFLDWFDGAKRSIIAYDWARWLESDFKELGLIDWMNKAIEETHPID